MNLLQRIEKLEKAIWREQRYNRPHKYFEPDSGEQILLWEKQVKDSGFNLDNFIVIILPPRPELVDWSFADSLSVSGVGLDDNSLSCKELRNGIIFN
jgi:hypothetical protein